MNAADFARVFSLPFAEAEAFFLDKLNIPTLAYDDLVGAAQAKAFVSAGAYQADLLDELRQITDRAIAGGMDLKEFRQQFRPLVARYGWQLKGGGSAWRSDLIWRTNIRSAYQAGRWQQFEDGGIEYLKYVHNDSVSNPRPHHVAMDGTVLPRTDPFWSKNYPPNGWGCHCRAVVALAGEIEKAGGRPEGWEKMADSGWDYNVGDSGKEQLAASMQQKLAKLPGDIAAAWSNMLSLRGLAEWIS
ncbi:MAG: phage head morphogenesis protein [Proteobacteria bacterium]|nr:phage head morphogenesis protein [Pseudomonadota bacterium]